MAQTYKLEDMDETTFQAGGDSQWSFEWLNYADGTYNVFSTFGNDSYCNFLDWYNPERMGGKRITEIEGVTSVAGVYTGYKASNLRNAWYNIAYTNPETADSYQRYCYVAWDGREGFGYELYGNKGRTSVVTFTVPEDGYYKVEGTVVREDNNYAEALILMPRFRFASSADPSKVTNYNVMTSAITYGNENCGEIDGWQNNTLAQGAEQRYLPQQPKDYIFYFQGKKGDKVSFEVNVQGMSYEDKDTQARAGWARTFLPKLDITVADESTATASTAYINPYGTAAAAQLTEYVEQLAEQLNGETIKSGTDVGTYPQDEITRMETVLNDIQEHIDNGEVNDMNAATYRAELEAAWNRLMASVNTVDWTAEGNYRLIYKNAGDIIVDATAMANNDGNPWNFQTHQVADGSYTNFTKHDTNNGNWKSCNTWYNSANWLFIADDGNIHPSPTQAPAYVFTAPQDAVYRVLYSFHRAQFNSSRSKELYMRARFMAAGTEKCDTSTYMFAQAYGYPAASYGEEKAMTFYVNLKRGDKVALELDAYTANNNTSARTIIDNLAINCRDGASSAVYTPASVPTGASYYDPYKPGDKTQLTALVDSASTLLGSTAGNIGTEEGQYNAEKAAELSTAVANAQTVCNNASATQVDVDNEVNALKQSIQAYIDARLPFEFKPRGMHGIRLAGTQQHWTRKNLASNNSYYATWATQAEVEADIAKNGTDIKEYSWTYLFSEWDTSTLAAEDIDPAAVGSTRITAPDTTGYVINGYVQIGELPAASTNYNVRFYKKEANDSVFCVKRADGTYWASGPMLWGGGHNYFNTSATPVYAFVIDDTILPGSNAATGIDAVADSSDKVIATRYYTIDGRRANSKQRGLLIRQNILDNGKVETVKVLVK